MSNNLYGKKNLIKLTEFVDSKSEFDQNKFLNEGSSTPNNKFQSWKTDSDSHDY